MLRRFDAAPWVVLLVVLGVTHLWPTPLHTSFAVAGLAAAGAALGGLAWAALALRAGRFGSPLRALTWAALLIPPYLSAVGLIEFLGPAGRVTRALGWATGPDLPTTRGLVYTWVSYGLLLAGAWLPLTALAVDAAWRRIDARSLAAARLARGTRGGIELHLAAARAPLWVGSLAVGVMSLGEFASAQLLRVKGISEEVHLLPYDLGAAVRTAAPLAAVAVLALVACLVATARPLPRLGHCTRPRLGLRSELVASLGALLLLIPGVWFPVGFLATRLGSRPGSRSAWEAALSALREAWAFAQGDVAYTAGVAAFTATWVTGLALLAVASLRRAGPVRRALTLAPPVVLAATPAPLIGIAVLTVGSAWTPLTWVRDSAAAVSLTWALRFAAWPLLLLAFSASRLPRSPLAAAELTPRPPLVRWLRVHAPPLLPALALSWGWVYALAVGEYEATLLVSPPGQSYLAVTVVAEAHYGQGHVLVGYVVLQLAVLAGPTLLAGSVWLAWRGVAQWRASARDFGNRKA